MMDFNGAARRALAALAVAAAMLAAAPAATRDKAELVALAQLEPGLWQLRDLEDSATPQQSICVSDPLALMQVQHRASSCSRQVIADGPKAVTVHYTCPASGFGRTTLRVETSKLAKIETQGIAENVPFAHRIEARRTGDCATRVSSAR